MEWLVFVHYVVFGILVRRVHDGIWLPYLDHGGFLVWILDFLIFFIFVLEITIQLFLNIYVFVVLVIFANFDANSSQMFRIIQKYIFRRCETSSLTSRYLAMTWCNDCSDINDLGIWAVRLRKSWWVLFLWAAWILVRRLIRFFFGQSSRWIILRSWHLLLQVWLKQMPWCSSNLLLVIIKLLAYEFWKILISLPALLLYLIYHFHRVLSLFRETSLEFLRPIWKPKSSIFRVNH